MQLARENVFGNAKFRGNCTYPEQQMGEDGLRVEGLVAPPVVLARIADENPNPAIRGGQPYPWILEACDPVLEGSSWTLDGCIGRHALHPWNTTALVDPSKDDGVIHRNMHHICQ